MYNFEARNNHPSNGAPGLKYDDADDDGIYKVLSRPAALAAGIGPHEAPQESSTGAPSYSRGRPNSQQRGNTRGFASRIVSKGRGTQQQSRNPADRGQDFSRGQDTGYNPRNTEQNPTQQPPYPQQGAPSYGQQFIPQPPPGWPNAYGGFIPPPPPPFLPQQSQQQGMNPWPFPFPPPPVPQMNAGMYINPNFSATGQTGSPNQNQNQQQSGQFPPPSNSPNQGNENRGRGRG